MLLTNKIILLLIKTFAIIHPIILNCFKDGDKFIAI